MSEPTDHETEQREPAEAALGGPIQGEEDASPTRDTLADGLERHLDPRSIPVGRITGWIAAILVSPALLIGMVIVVVAVDLPVWAAVLIGIGWALATTGLCFLAHFWPPLEHRYARYRLSAREIEIKKGVWWRSVTNVALSRVQHTDVSQGPLERAYGLGSLHIYTAGTEHSEVLLHGLDHELALRIRDQLLAKEGDDTV